MERIGLLPLGDMEGTSYFNIVPNSIHEQFCPQGMRNIIGMIPGADPALNDEYVIFSAHYDGPNNENPQTETTRGNQDTTNTFDDALAVAFGLGLAEEMMLKNPPKRNVIFLFDDVEEGWNSVLTPPKQYTVDGNQYSAEEMVDYWCYVEDGKSYFNSVMLSKPGFEGYIKEGSCNDAVQVGFGSWLREPTVDISKVKLIFNIDPLGIPPGVRPEDLVLAVLNGETSTGVNSQGSSVSLNDIVDEALPEPPVSYAKFPRAVVENTNSADALTSPKTYGPLCEAGNNCRDDGGIPNVSYVAVTVSSFCHMLIILTEHLDVSQIWLAALSFQKYHGGNMINEFKQLFQQFSAKGLYQDENLPDTAYFSVDKADAGNFEAEALNALTTSLSAFISNLFAMEELSSLTFSKDNPPDDDTYKYNKEDLANLKNSMVFLSKRIDAIAPELDFYKVAQGIVITQLNNLEAVPPEMPEFQENIKKLALTSVALQLSLDTFNKQYTEKEAYLDQTVYGDVVAEPAKSNDVTSEVDGVEDALPEDNEVATDEGQDNSSTTATTSTTSSSSDPSSATASAQVGLLVTTALALACSFSTF